MAIIKPTGVTIQWLERRNPEFLNIIDETIDELQVENDMWMLQTEIEKVKSEQKE